MIHFFIRRNLEMEQKRSLFYYSIKALFVLIYISLITALIYLFFMSIPEDLIIHSKTKYSGIPKSMTKYENLNIETIKFWNEIVNYFIGFLIWISLINQIIGLICLITGNNCISIASILLNGIGILLNFLFGQILIAVIGLVSILLTFLFMYISYSSISRVKFFYWTTLSSESKENFEGIYKSSEFEI